MKKQAIIRLIVMIVLLINQTLIVVGYNPLPFSEEQIFDGVSSLATAAMAVYVWWKDNPVTKNAVMAQDKMKELKGKE